MVCGYLGSSLSQLQAAECPPQPGRLPVTTGPGTRPPARAPLAASLETSAALV